MEINRIRSSGEMLKSDRRNTNMLEGPLFGKILLFVLPLMIANLLQTFYNAADMMVVSLSDEPNAVGAIGTTGAMVNMILNIFTGLSLGANVVVARRLGAGDPKGVSRAVHTALIGGLTFGVLGAGVGLIVSRPVLSLMGAQENLLDLAVLYTKIYFSGLPFVALTNFLISIFRAKGDTKTPLVVLTLTGLLNVGLNLFFVLVVRLSVEGVAISTVAANAVSAVVLLWRLSRESGPCRFSARTLCLDWRAFREMLFIGIPASIQGWLFSLSNMIIQSAVLTVNNASISAGEAMQPIVNGNAAAANLEAFVYTATNSVYQATVTFTSQNAGAGNFHRIPRIMGSSYFITTMISFLVGESIFLLRVPLLSLYGIRRGADSLMEMAYHTAYLKMFYQFTFYFLGASMEVGSGTLRGLGKSITSTCVSFTGICLFRIIWIATVFRSLGTLESIYVSYPISWGLTALCHFIAILFILRKKRRAEPLSLTP